jgi:hypothetical protein
MLSDATPQVGEVVSRDSKRRASIQHPSPVSSFECAAHGTARAAPTTACHWPPGCR